MKIKTLKDFDFKDKVVLLRTDINSDLSEKRLIESERIKPASETISYLIKKKAKVIVIAHQGNPGNSDFSSLSKHSEYLNKYVKIRFIKDILGKKSKIVISNLKQGEAILLENIRYEKDEFNPEKRKNKILEFFLPRIDIYVNDSFSVCHRNHTSITQFPKYKQNCVGLSLEKEINALKKISIKNCLYILAGAKPQENIKLLKKGRTVLAAGIFGQMCLESQGIKLGETNKKENKGLIKGYEEILGRLRNKIKSCRIITPQDYAIEVKNKREELSVGDFPTKYIIYDIGKKTQEEFIKEIKKAEAIYMKGPVGYASKKKFAEGTFNVLKAISESKAFSLIGGGHLSDAIRESKIPKSKFSHISLSGGALLSYIAGEKLPGLKSLGYYN